MQPLVDSIPEDEIEDYSELGRGVNGDELEKATERLIQAVQKGYKEIDDAQTIMDYIDSKLAQNLKCKDLTKMISSPAQNLYYQVCNE